MSELLKSGGEGLSAVFDPARQFLSYAHGLGVASLFAGSDGELVDVGRDFDALVLAHFVNHGNCLDAVVSVEEQLWTRSQDLPDAMPDAQNRR